MAMPEKHEDCPTCGESERWNYDGQICARCGYNGLTGAPGTPPDPSDDTYTAIVPAGWRIVRSLDGEQLFLINPSGLRVGEAPFTKAGCANLEAQAIAAAALAPKRSRKP